MIGLALNLIAFFVILSFIVYFGSGIISFIATIFGSSTNNNEAKGLLRPVMKKLNISDGEIMNSDTLKEVLNEAIEIYYKILTKVFETETSPQRKDILSFNSPSGKLSNAFFEISGVGKSLNVLTKDLEYVMEGSGWTEYKKILEEATKANLKKIGSKKYEFVFKNDFLLKIEEYKSFDYSEDLVDDKETEWQIVGNYKNKDVLSCYSPRTNNIAYTFKPDLWILNIVKSADRYSKHLNEFKLKEATKRRKAELFS
jgi:hypothetical protein